MASPYQQLARQRKLIYTGLILALFTLTWGWRHWLVDAQAHGLALREEDSGEVELSGRVVRLSLTGLRGVATCFLWSTAMEKQKKNQWNELELIIRSLTKLQPHFLTPWLFQSWNLAYNVSVESDRVRDKYFYVSRGVTLLAEGERQNANNPDIRYWIGFYMQHKICLSDETNVIRSLWQLSCMRPNERDPNRFRKISDVPVGDGKTLRKVELNLAEFEKFCKEHPQLVRRLREGTLRDSRTEQAQLFTCERPEDVVQFLQDNFRVPSMYEDAKLAPDNGWQEQGDKLRKPETDRFPPLPPARNPQPPLRLFDPTEKLVSGTPLGDDVDGYTAARAWYSYSQEPIPDPDVLPGSIKPIEDPIHQRRPKQIAGVIFRGYPARAQTYIGERLYQEGWYDESGWTINGWFKNDRFDDGNGEPAVIGKVNWGQEAWQSAAERWERHGRENHLLISKEQEENDKKLAEKFFTTFNMPIGDRRVREKRPEDFATRPDMAEAHAAALFLLEYSAARQMSNFYMHYIRSQVEAHRDTVLARKGFYTAERLRMSGSPDRSLMVYKETLPKWRDVLLKNKDYRSDDNIGEESYEWQWKYLKLFNDQKGTQFKERFSRLADVVPLVPKLPPADVKQSIIEETLAAYDGDGPDASPIVSLSAKVTFLQRKNLPLTGLGLTPPNVPPDQSKP
jgi:hypothetical protein